MKIVEFVKMVAAGNDFVIIDNRKGLFSKNTQKLAKILGDRKSSIGADGVIFLEKSKKADIGMNFFNSDGSSAEMCGNGVRCLAKFAEDKKIIKSKAIVETLAGIIEIEIKGSIVKARLVDPKGMKLGFEIHVDGKSQKLNFINTGVPHAVSILDSVENVDVDGQGRAIRYHEHFAPRGTNANFISIKNAEIFVRTYERGVEAETLACGTGSSASALIASAVKNLKSPVSVHTRSGETLKVYFSKNGSGFHDVYLEGKVKKVFEGRIFL